MEHVDVIITKYKTIDGKIFDNKDQALHHEGILNGTIKKCPTCKGTGQVDPYGDRLASWKCSTCEGKGFLVKQDVWK